MIESLVSLAQGAASLLTAANLLIIALGSIVGNASLITKVYMPKYIYPLTRVMSSVVNLGISLIPLLIVCVITGVEFHKSAVLAVFFLIYGVYILLAYTSLKRNVLPG